MKTERLTSQPLPCAVQIGFAGSRRLFDAAPLPQAENAELLAAVERYLSDRLAELPAQLGFEAGHFLVGISQVAAGADILFTRVCRNLKMPQRIFLPQHREEYLSAVNAVGRPDFTTDERREAETLLDAEHIIQECVVSHAADRTVRFAETNLEILRASEVIVCLLRADAEASRCGTTQLLDRAIRNDRPVLEIRVGLREGRVEFIERWHNLGGPGRFDLPRLPAEIERLAAESSCGENPELLPSCDEYCQRMKHLVGKQVRWHQSLFKFAAVTIVATHTLATLLAAYALSHHGHGDSKFGGLLLTEALLLLAGVSVHWRLHHSGAARVWAVSRLIAEVARSLRAIRSSHVCPDYLAQLHLPRRLAPLLRTLTVLHLRSSRRGDGETWPRQRDRYLQQRVDNQVGFYATRLASEQKRLWWCRSAFWVCSSIAVVLAILKTGFEFCSNRDPDVSDWLSNCESWFGVLAIVLPVAAAGVLTFAAALDYEARVDSFGETLDFLGHQRPLLEQAQSAPEWDRLLLETEAPLLGEVAQWFSRRSTIGVA